MLVFVIGRPASGKTTIINRARNFLDNDKITSGYVTDHELLASYLERPEMRGRIEPSKPKGFLVTDMSLLDEVLDDVCAEVNVSSGKVDVFFVDFSRSNYCSAINRLIGSGCRPDLIVYLAASIATARRRNRYKEVYGSYMVPDKTMIDIFTKDDLQELRKRKDTKLLEIPNDVDGEEEAGRAAVKLAHAVQEML